MYLLGGNILISVITDAFFLASVIKIVFVVHNNIR